MKFGWFGKSWGAPICAEEDHKETPIGECCRHCGEVFVEGDQGLIDMMGYAIHVECNLRSIIGGANHILGFCSCCGGTNDPDPPGLSKREAAKLAMAEWEKKNGLSRP